MFYITGQLSVTFLIFVLWRKHHFLSNLEKIHGIQIFRIYQTWRYCTPSQVQCINNFFEFLIPKNTSIEVYNHIHSERLLTKFG